MAKNDNLQDFLIDVANAIRSKTGKTDPINPQDFSSEIMSITTGASFSIVGDWIFEDYIKLTFHSGGGVTYGDVNGTLVVEGTYSISGNLVTIRLTYGGNIEELLVEYIPENDTLKLGEGDDVLIFVRASATNKFSSLVDGSITELTRQDLANVTEIRYGAFITTPLVNVEIPSNVKIIGGSAFTGCESLTTLVLDDGIEEIGQSAFSYAQVKDIVLPKTISVLKEWVFEENYALESITIPENITEIKADVFRGCTNLTEITMESMTPPSVTSTSFPASVTSIYVPYGAYDTYVSQWSSYASKIVRLPAIPSTITVTVNNYLNELVNGASVTITGNGQTFTGTTNENGVFVQGDLQPATYTISVADMDGFKTPESVEVVVEEDTQNSATFTYLEKPAIEILPNFSDNTPLAIATVANEIAYKGMTSAEVESTFGWKIGDTTSYTLSTGENVEVRIIGFNHDNLSDGTGKAGITLETTHCLATKYIMQRRADGLGATNQGGYANSSIKKSYLPKVYENFPQEWKDVVKLVDKEYADGGDTNYSGILTTSLDLFVLSKAEMSLSASYVEGFAYEYWKTHTTNADYVKLYDSDGDGVIDTATDYWFRTPTSFNRGQYYMVGSNGHPHGYKNSDSTLRLAFAFCVGSASDYVPN